MTQILIYLKERLLTYKEPRVEWCLFSKPIFNTSFEMILDCFIKEYQFWFDSGLIHEIGQYEIQEVWLQWLDFKIRFITDSYCMDLELSHEWLINQRFSIFDSESILDQVCIASQNAPENLSPRYIRSCPWHVNHDKYHRYYYTWHCWSY